MSRFILKNIPHWINEKNLLSFFSEFGIITDIKLLTDEIGNSRNLCFLGFSKKIALQYLQSVLHDNFLGKIVISARGGRSWEDTGFHDQASLSSISSSNQTNYLRKFILLIKNISFTASFHDVEALLKSFGHFFCLAFTSYIEKESHLYYAKISYAFSESTVRAACNLDGKVFQGRILRVLKIQSAQKINAKKKNFTFQNFKILLQREKKGKNSCAEPSWFNIFIPKEKLVERIIAKFGVPTLPPKHSPRGPKHGLMPFIPEARIQNEALFFLKKEGFFFNFKVFGHFVKKSQKKIFLQNFPISDLVSVKIFFQKFGQVETIAIFFSINLVIVGYNQKKDAKKAFHSVEKICIGNTNLVLGWIPIQTRKNPEKFNHPWAKATQGGDVLPFPSGTRLKRPEETIVVKKKDLWSKKIKWTQKQKDTKLSRREGPKRPTGKNLRGKILIRNLPFNSSFDDLKKNFSPIAPILSIRMPKKNPTQIKGYAFVEFRSMEEAKKVIHLTQKSHFFSRHLSMSLLL